MPPVETATRAFFSWHRRRVHEPRVERVAASFASLVPHASSLLDVGAGDGTLAVALSQRIGATKISGVEVQLRPNPAIFVAEYNGIHLPFDNNAFEVVVLADVLHHAPDPRAVLSESLRVASHAVLIKDHFQFGPLSSLILKIMDLTGNRSARVPSPGHYFSTESFNKLVTQCGGAVEKMHWPMRIHDWPIHLITRDEHQFTAKVVRASTRKSDP
ncbi:MAG: class I SAM-dependent methyltransferase [Polyangiaceae bacterium]|nr:class I SAM-dependent methyltransferase [Polyangiaceae bacterium]